MDKEIIEIKDINPIDFYNQNGVEDVINLMVFKIKPLERIGINALTFVINKPDKTERMIIVDSETKTFEAIKKNGLKMELGVKYTPFMMLHRFVFKGHFFRAMSYVIYEVMNNKADYIRVGTDYYQRIIKPDRYGIEREELKLWKKTTIIDDHGKEILDKIELFKDFTMEPNNKTHARHVGDFYNLYSKFDHEPCDIEDYIGVEQFEWTEKLLRHIFGEHYELGLKYLKVLYEHPKQTLPILVLISEERQTGKTTFVNYMSILFGANTVVINPQDIGNSFNGAYTEKNIIMIEESHFDSRQALEKIKNLSTQKEILVNTKFIQQYSMPFFGKIIITSNDENKFSKVDEEEIRYWVRKIPTLTGKENHNILETMKNEIPFFLKHLELMDDIDFKRSRMVFTREELSTSALQAVQKESREGIHKDILIYLDNHAQQHKDVEEFFFIGIHIKDAWFQNNSRYNVSYINNVLKTKMKLDKVDKAKRFIPLQKGLSDMSETVVGRPYIYKNPYFGTDEVDLDFNDLDTPF